MQFSPYGCDAARRISNKPRGPDPALRMSRRLAMATASSCLALGLPATARAELFPARNDLDALYDDAVDAAIRSGLELLVARQNLDGTFLSAEQGKWIGVCALVGLAWLSRGVRPGKGLAGEALLRTSNYILSKVQASGFLSAKNTSHGPMYDHGFGTLFLAELYGTSREMQVREPLSSAVKLIINTQSPAGGWRYNPAPDDADLSVTVCQMMALRAARNAGIGVPKETIDRAVEYVRRSQNPDGGFMYQVTGGESRFPLTAAAVVALHNAGIHEGSEIEAAFDYLRLHGAANRTFERNNFFYYAHYYSVQAFGQLGGEGWEKWYAALRRTLMGLRNAQGGWFDFNSLEYGTAMSCLILNMPRTVLPIFQR